MVDNETLTALQISIKKWERNATTEDVEDVTIGPSSCPLCSLFLDLYCRGCPVMKATGLAGCENSPYEGAEHAYFRWKGAAAKSAADQSKEVFQACARDEGDFLKSLLPKENNDGA